MIDYSHKHYAHCESGVMSAILKQVGFEISEPMVFGLTTSLTFAHIPFMKMGNLPVTSYRMFPGAMIKKLPKLLKVKYVTKKYRNQQHAMDELDDCLQHGRIVGLQCSVYFLPYFPPEMRFQFNAHNILVVAKTGNAYTVSDPVFDHMVSIHADDLRKARFARGLSAPKGFMHYPLAAPVNVDLEKLIKKSLVKMAHMMLHAPAPYIGIKGMRYLANRIEKLPRTHDIKYVKHFIGNVVRMQEEIGTGGGGFRFLYAAYLQEAYSITGNTLLKEASEKMTQVGDQWRQFALACAHIIKSKNDTNDTKEAARLIRICADQEQAIYRLFSQVK